MNIDLATYELDLLYKVFELAEDSLREERCIYGTVEQWEIDRVVALRRKLLGV